MSVLGELKVLSPAVVSTKKGSGGGYETEALVVAPDGKNVLACCRGESSLVNFTRSVTTGKLTFLEGIAFGTELYGVAITPDGENVYLACQGSTKLGWYKRNLTTGVLKKEGEVTGGKSMHCLTVSPDGKFLYAPSYEEKAIFQYEIEAGGKPKALSTAKVTGAKQPHNIVITANGEYGYCSTGEGESSVVIFSRNSSSGLLTVKETKTMTGVGLVEIVRLGPEDKTLYVVQGAASRTEKSEIAVFTRNTSTGALTLLEKIVVGKEAKDIAISADGKSAYITLQGETGANQICQYSRNIETGALTALSPATVAPGEETFGPSFIVLYEGAWAYAAMKEGPLDAVAQFSRFVEVAGSGLGMMV